MICPCNICPGDICLYHQYLTQFWTNFLEPIFWGSNIFLTNILLDPNFWDIKLFGPKIILGPKFFLDPISFGPKIILDPIFHFNTNSVWPKTFGTKIYFDPKIFGPNTFWTHNVLDTKYLCTQIVLDLSGWFFMIQPKYNKNNTLFLGFDSL